MSQSRDFYQRLLLKCRAVFGKFLRSAIREKTFYLRDKVSSSKPEIAILTRAVNPHDGSFEYYSRAAAFVFFSFQSVRSNIDGETRKSRDAKSALYSNRTLCHARGDGPVI